MTLGLMFWLMIYTMKALRELRQINSLQTVWSIEKSGKFEITIELKSC